MTALTPLEALALTDVETPVFSGEPSEYCVAFGGRGEADLAIWRSSVRQRFPPGSHYKAVATVLGSKPAAADSPVGQTERLRLIGRTRDIERYEGETDEQYCERLAGAFPAWIQAGTPNAIAEQLVAFGFSSVDVLEEYEGDLSPGASEYGWRFAIRCRGPEGVGWPGCIVGQAQVGTDTVGLGKGSAAQVSAVKRIGVKWKQVFALPMRVFFVWGDPPLVGDAEVGGAVLGEGTVIEEPMADVRSVGYAVVGQTPLVGFNF